MLHTPEDNRASHPGPRVPCAFLDGHGQPLSMDPEYWNNTPRTYSSPGAVTSTTLYDREVERFIWFVR